MSFNQFAPGSFKIHQEPASLVPTLTPGTYVLNFHPMMGYYVDSTDNFSVPSKVYGESPEYVDLIMKRAFADRAGKVTTAVLSGIKGSGKTLTAKQVSLLALEQGISTFIVNNPYCGDSFTEFLQALNKQVGKFILIIDEFEKIYTEQEQLNSLLTLLDGTATLDMLVMLTMNSTLDEARFEFFKNRPGRTYFNIYFPPCSDEVIRDYCKDHLEEVEKTEMILAFTRRFSNFTLDMLTALVYEFNKSVDKNLLRLTEIFNIKPDIGLSNEAYTMHTTYKTTGKPRVLGSMYNFVSRIFSYNEYYVEFTVRETDPEFKKLVENWEELDRQQGLNISPQRLCDFDEDWEVPKSHREKWKEDKESEEIVSFSVSVLVKLEYEPTETPLHTTEISYENRTAVFKLNNFDVCVALAAAAPKPSKRQLLL